MLLYRDIQDHLIQFKCSKGSKKENQRHPPMPFKVTLTTGQSVQHTLPFRFILRTLMLLK